MCCQTAFGSWCRPLPLSVWLAGWLCAGKRRSSVAAAGARAASGEDGLRHPHRLAGGVRPNIPDRLVSGIRKNKGEGGGGGGGGCTPFNFDRPLGVTPIIIKIKDARHCGAAGAGAAAADIKSSFTCERAENHSINPYDPRDALRNLLFLRTEKNTRVSLHHMRTRLSGATNIASPSFTSNAV